MRVIAGSLKGRKLNSPYDSNVRPTSDKVKEAMFSILMPYTYGAIVCDMFSGSGGLGIEAISRGAEKTYFMDIANDSIKLLKENISKCGISDKVKILQGDSIKGLSRINEKIDVFLIDPPYNFNLELESLEEISKLDILAEEGIIVVEHSKNSILPDNVGRLSKIKERKYGSIVLSIYM